MVGAIAPTYVETPRVYTLIWLDLWVHDNIQILLLLYVISYI